MLRPARREAIEDLALYLRQWAKENRLNVGEGIQDVVTAFFVAQQSTPQEWQAEALTQAAWAVVHQRREAYSHATIAEMVRNVNDILRGRA